MSGRGACASTDPVTTEEPATTTRPDSSSIVSAALDYRARGWHPIRVYGLQPDGVSCTCRNGTACRDAGKHPTDRAWQQAPPLTSEQIRDAWGGWWAGHNVRSEDG